jgi:SHS2 domain-containing protein
MGFQELDHTADHALKISGGNLKELFISAAEGMTSLMIADMSGISEEIEKTIEIDAIDTESLLVEWLSELAYWAEAEMLVFKTFRIQNITANHLAASVAGGKFAALQKHIKAVTYHNLKIVKTLKDLEVTIVFDV